MYIVLVNIHVKEDSIEAFIQATTENASQSVKEPGIARFDFIQQTNDPTRFVLVEVYRTQQDTVLHKETNHYKKWRNTVAQFMAEERKSEKFSNIFPDEMGWG